MNGSILAIRSRTADTSAFTARFWKPWSHRRQPAPLRLVALQHLYATTMRSGHTSRSANAPLQASTSLRPVPCQRDFRSRITRPKRRCARSGPTARSNGEATSSTFAALSLVKLSPSRKPRTDPGKCASSTCRSASSTRKHVSCVAAPAPRRTRSNHEQVSPIHPVRFVTHPSAGQRTKSVPDEGLLRSSIDWNLSPVSNFATLMRATLSHKGRGEDHQTSFSTHESKNQNLSDVRRQMRGGDEFLRLAVQGCRRDEYPPLRRRRAGRGRIGDVGEFFDRQPDLHVRGQPGEAWLCLHAGDVAVRRLCR